MIIYVREKSTLQEAMSHNAHPGHLSDCINELELSLQQDAGMSNWKIGRHMFFRMIHF